MVAESNGLNLCLGVNSHTQRSPPHTRSHARRRETDSACGLPEKITSKLAPSEGKTPTDASISGNKRRLSVSGHRISKKDTLFVFVFVLFFGESAPRRRRNPGAKTRREEELVAIVENTEATCLTGQMSF